MLLVLTKNKIYVTAIDMNGNLDEPQLYLFYMF